MDTARTHLGTKELHKRHAVLVEGGKIPRARVMDQHIVDRYLMRGWLNLQQHIAAEFIMKQAATARLWPSGVNLSGTRVDGGKRNNVPFGVFPYGRTIKTVEKHNGPWHAYVIERVIVNEWDVSANDHNMKCLQEGLDCVAAYRMGYHKHPLRHIKMAIESRKERKKTAPEGAASQVGALP